MLQLQDVTKAFGEKTLLEHVTWQVGDRDRVGLCGPNGAGKTTLLKMPGMDGLTLIREAKRLKTDLPVIIITGLSTESSAIEAVNLGVAGYLTKPFRVPQVLAAAARALGE